MDDIRIEVDMIRIPMIPILWINRRVVRLGMGTVAAFAHWAIAKRATR
ncbi:MAG: hypothetical protein AAGF53_18765 [Pseudomonadota bacterium]